MRSPAERRLPWERAARAVALALLVFVFARLLLGSRAARVPSVHLAVAGEVSARTRDSLAALARAGDAVTWSGEVAAVAAVAEPVRDPSARTRISAVGDGALALTDSLGDLDSLPAGGGSITASGLRGAVRTREGFTFAQASPPPSVQPGRVLVLGRVGWESKFTVAALEEAGWKVDARLRLSETLRVTQGNARTPAIGTHAAVIALDTALGADAAAITRFVRGGGGLVLSGEAAGATALASLVPARAGQRVDGEPDALETDEPQQALALHALIALRSDAVVIERRGDDVAVAARRVVAGRVVQSGYEESWRWRMQGGASGAREHREYWTRLVAAAAASSAPASRAPEGKKSTTTGTTGSADESAPRAILVHRLGPSVPAAPTTPPPPRPLPAWLGVLTLTLLVAEWASRRARGAP